MPPIIIDPLQGGLRAVREIQAPQQVGLDDTAPGGVRISSAAFGPGSDQTVSIDLEESLLLKGLNVTSRFPSLPRAVGAVACTVDQIKAVQLDVKHAPIVGNDHHGEIRAGAKKMTKKERREVARVLAAKCEVVVPFDKEAIRRYEEAKAQ